MERNGESPGVGVIYFCDNPIEIIDYANREIKEYTIQSERHKVKKKKKALAVENS